MYVRDIEINIRFYLFIYLRMNYQREITKFPGINPLKNCALVKKMVPKSRLLFFLPLSNGKNYSIGIYGIDIVYEKCLSSKDF